MFLNSKIRLFEKYFSFHTHFVHICTSCSSIASLLSLCLIVTFVTIQLTATSSFLVFIPSFSLPVLVHSLFFHRFFGYSFPRVIHQSKMNQIGKYVTNSYVNQQLVNWLTNSLVEGKKDSSQFLS